MKKNIFKIIATIFVLLLPMNLYAVIDNELVMSAEKYLNSITGLAGDFTQTANGKKEQGTFSMLRPGRVRLDYKKMPVQLISDGTDLYFFDKSLDQITTVPLSSTPAGILVRKNIKLVNSDITVFGTEKTKNTFTIKMNMRDNPGIGSMSVVFGNAPVKLNSWTVLDAVGNKTDVVFGDLKTKTDFEKNYFQIQRHKTISAGAGDSYYE